jgi:alkylation response protein AidB-like acyl-CoA dehydrogenase
MSTRRRITSPESSELVELSTRLRVFASDADEHRWPQKQMDACAEYGVFEWFATKEWGGQGWNEAELVRGYLALGMGCLTTTFIITQRTGACQRIERSQNPIVPRRLLPDLIAGRSFATVGISHLTTSRQHLDQPVLRAEQAGQDFLLDGYSPWVTGANHAQHLVVGATFTDQRQILVAIPTDIPGITIPDPEPLIGLAGSHTGKVQFDRVRVTREWLLAGPVPEVMKQGVGARTGGLQTSTLALALSKTSIDYLLEEARHRNVLASPADALLAEWNEIVSSLFAAAENHPKCSDAELRTRANSLVLRATQAALVAAKGAGYVLGHPAGRWCREALFFLVWSCPQPVLAANLCEFAGIV